MNIIDFFEDTLYKILEKFSFSNFIFNKLINFSYSIFKSDYFNKSNELNSENDSLNLIFTDGDIKPNKTLRNIQLLYLEMFRFIDNICKKYDIEYWLYAGTLLGAVRHGGFIPWDDDLDVQLTRNDYNKLIEVLPKEIEKYDYLKENCGLTKLVEGEKNYFTDFKSIYDVENIEGIRGTRTKVLFLQWAWLKPFVKIDFFPMDFIKEDKFEFFKSHQRLIKFKFNQNIQKAKVNFDEEWELRNNELGLTKEKTDFIAMSIEAYKLEETRFYNTKDIFPLKEINFDKYKFKAPNNTDACLKVSFGSNYMSLPKAIETHNTVDFVKSQFLSIEEMDKEFEKTINYFKEINDNFE